jgi:alkylated DNA repair protein (DNA oxidative demethylase)
MTRSNDSLFASLIDPAEGGIEVLGEGAAVLRGFAAADAEKLVTGVNAVARLSPFRHMVTRGGFQMSVAMTNCGSAGWVTDRRGYRYDSRDPETGQPWPAMPMQFLKLAQSAAAAAGFPSFAPDACLINRYRVGARMSLHQDRDELDYEQPIVSVSLGLEAVFLFGGQQRSEKPKRVRLVSGDVVVWGGPVRLAFHGVAPLAAGTDSLLEDCRINLTFRKAR